MGVAIPDYQTLMLPLQRRRCATGPCQIRDLIAAMAAEFHLTDAERAEMLPSGHVTVVASRTHWAKTYLKNAGLVSQPRRGMVEITPAGLSLLAESPERLDNAVLSRFPEFRVWKDRCVPQASGEDQPTGDAPVLGHVASAALATPDEQIERAYKELDADLRGARLERILAAPPDFFEKLIIGLPRAMGYGGTEKDAGERLGRSSDGGVDGVIREDRLGLDLLYLQAKRYQMSNKVWVDAVRSFAGALNDVGAQKGILITTSGFSAEAVAYARRQQTKRIILMDGETLTTHMVSFNVGVRPHRRIEIKRVDHGYFEDEDVD